MIKIALMLVLAVAGRPLLYFCVGYLDYLVEISRERKRMRKSFRHRRDQDRAGEAAIPRLPMRFNLTVSERLSGGQ
jgi:hypothetical protein